MFHASSLYQELSMQTTSASLPGEGKYIDCLVLFMIYEKEWQSLTRASTRILQLYHELGISSNKSSKDVKSQGERTFNYVLVCI